MANYIAKFTVVLNKCSDIIDIEAKFLYEEIFVLR